MKCVKIEKGIVVNSAMFDEVPAGWVESDAGVGDTYDDIAGVFLRREDNSGVFDERAKNMLAGSSYNGYQVSFTADDGNGMLQVKAAFELGLAETNIHFSNGVVMPITAAEFSDFSLWFVERRNSFF